MGVLIHDIVINNQKVDDIYITGPDIEMSDEYIDKICIETIKEKYNKETKSFKWSWKV